MYGPNPAGFWSGHCRKGPYRHLVPGKRYVVKIPFTNYDGHTHLAGESWTFVGWSCSAYDDGLSLFVSFDDENEWHIRLSTKPWDQADIDNSLSSHLEEIVPPDLA